jgi:hypothetical protein
VARAGSIALGICLALTAGCESTGACVITIPSTHETHCYDDTSSDWCRGAYGDFHEGKTCRELDRPSCATGGTPTPGPGCYVQ